MELNEAITKVRKIMGTSVPELFDSGLEFATQTKTEKSRAKTMPSKVRQKTIDYFCRRYTVKIGGFYRKSNISDSKSVNEIFLFLDNNGLNKEEYAPKFIDWCFDNKTRIVKERHGITLQTICHYLNQFYQDTVLPAVEEGTVEREAVIEINLIREIKEIETTSNAFNIFAKYGIPVGVTYFVNVKKMPQEDIVKGVKEAIKKYQREAIGQQKISQMFKKSILSSPYPPEMCGLNWREYFAPELIHFKKESWWRESDYKGKPLPIYQPLVTT